jgi:WD40 repeat protein
LVRTLAFSPDGKVLAAGGRNKLIYVWNLDSPETARTFAGHEDEIASLVFSPDGKSLLSGQIRGDLRLWDVATGEVRQVFKARRPAHLFHLDWSSNGLYFADAGTRPLVYLFDGKTGKEAGKIEGFGSYITRVRFSPDGTILATGGLDNQVRLFAVSGDPASPPLTAKELHRFAIDEGPDDLAFFPDGKRLAVAHRNGRCSLWAAETAERLAECEAHPGGTRAVAVSPDGLSIATGGMDRTLAVWDVKALLDSR